MSNAPEFSTCSCHSSILIIKTLLLQLIYYSLPPPLSNHLLAYITLLYVSSLNQHSHSLFSLFFSSSPLILSLPSSSSFLYFTLINLQFLYAHHFSTALYLPITAPPNVGVQKSTLLSLATGNVLEIGTKHSPRLLRSSFRPSDSFRLSQSFKHNNIQIFQNPQQISTY